MISQETVKYSLRNLKSRKTRSFFTILSIFIGITTIFIFVSFGLGLYNYIDELTQGSSADKVIIQPIGGTFSIFDSTIRFDEGDIRAIKGVPGVKKVTGSYFKTVEIESQDTRIYGMLMSYDPKNKLVLEASNIDLIKGKHVSGSKKEAVIGYSYSIPSRVFDKEIEINQNILINGEEVKVVGFMEEVGNPQDDTNVYMSNDFMEEFYASENISYGWIIAKVELNEIDLIIPKIEKALRNHRNLDEGKEDFYVQSFQDLVDGFSTALNIVVGFIILIALISVLVSAINTANTMITSVLERTREIGIIKSIGARNSDVFGIFLFESSFLGFIAGIIGVLIGFIVSYTGMVILQNIGYGFLKPDFSPILFISCIIFATITGAISGALPARNASKTSPVEALRYE